jgi:hypothetical protein
LVLAVDGTEEIKYDWGLSKVKNVYIDRSIGLWASPKEQWQQILEPFIEQLMPTLEDNSSSDTLLPEHFASAFVE